jgi:hypothetical protein
MNEEQNPQDEIRNEFRKLGRSLFEVMQNTWESAERQKIQHDIEEGLSEFANSMKEEARKFEESQTGQQIKSEFTGIKDRFQKGEIQESLRVEILKALRAINLELDKSSQAWKEKKSTDDKSESSS